MTEKIINKVQWYHIPGYIGYEISTLGRVRSLDRLNTLGVKIKGKVLNLNIDGTGYYHVRLYRRSKPISVQTHIIVAIVFHNYIVGGGLVADHKDNDKLNNIPSNIQLITQRENSSKDRFRNKNKSSKYVGVCWNKQANKWQANVWNGVKRLYLGLFIIEEDARDAYNNKLIQILKSDYDRKNN